MKRSEIDVKVGGFAKPNNSWLGRWFLLQTFDNDTDCDVAKMRKILDDLATSEDLKGWEK